MRPDKTHRDAADLGGGARVVYEDAELLVVDKPAGMISGKPDDQTGKTLFHLVKRHAGDVEGPKPGGGRHARREDQAEPGQREQRAWIIHRLDRDVSGLLVFAKTRTAYLALKDQLQRRQIRRRYIAVVSGQMPLTPEGQWKWIEAFLEDAGPGKRVRIAKPGTMQTRRRPGAEAPERAVTYYRVLASAAWRSLLAVRLETGKKHQIRVHLASEGHAILGDRLYGRGRDRVGRLALHGWELAFAHPATGQELCFYSRPPTGFLEQAGATQAVLEKEALNIDVAAAPSDGAVAAPWAATSLPAGKGVAARSAATAPTREKNSRTDAGWDHVAGWYEGLVSGHRSDYHEDLIVPGVLRLLAVQKGQRVLDVACGEGLVCRQLAQLGVECVGVDASPHLIATAVRLAKPLPDEMRPRFITGDARRLEELPELARRQGTFDAVLSVLALMNIDPIEPVLRGAAALLAPGGRFTAVIMHPAFRAPGQTSWGFEYPPGHVNKRQRRSEARRGGAPGDRREDHRGPEKHGGAAAQGAGQMHQYRRVEAYLSPLHREIVMNPGAAAHGKEAVTTVTWHRPIQAYVKAFADAGLLLDALEEWPSHRLSDTGPFADEHDRARREIPMFLALRGRKLGS